MRNRGQSMVEYALIAIIVIVGIVIMGPYVLRSINAHFKLWDEGVRDSYQEVLQQAPVGDVPDIPLTCTCTAPTKGNCGSSQAGPGGCSPCEREYDINCTPQGCDGSDTTFNCVPDPTCNNLQPLGCGKYPCPATGCPTTCPTGPLADGNCAPPAQGQCWYRWQMSTSACDMHGQMASECSHDLQCPPPVCTSIPEGTTFAPCPNSPGTGGGTETLVAYFKNHNPPLEESDQDIVTVSSLSACTVDDNGNPSPCQYYSTASSTDYAVAINPQDTSQFTNPNDAKCGYGLSGGGGVQNYCAGSNGGSPIDLANAAWVCTHAANPSGGTGFKYIISWCATYGSNCDTSCRYKWLQYNCDSTGEPSAPSVVDMSNYTANAWSSHCEDSTAGDVGECCIGNCSPTAVCGAMSCPSCCGINCHSSAAYNGWGVLSIVYCSDNPSAQLPPGSVTGIGGSSYCG